jgi:small subunit ribosomal protein S10
MVVSFKKLVFFIGKLTNSRFVRIEMEKVRIRLQSIDINKLNDVIKNIKEIASTSGVLVSGPIPLPTRRLKVTTRKSPCGNGTATFDNFEMRIHKRILDLPGNDKVLHNIMRIQIPRTVFIKIEMLD